MGARRVLGASLALLFLAAWASRARADLLDALYEWDAVPYFSYRIEQIDYDPGTREVAIRFSVRNPLDGDAPYDIHTDEHFLPALNTSLVLDVGWSAGEYTNVGALDPEGASYPIAIDARGEGVAQGDGTYLVTRTLPVEAYGTGTVVMEGHPRWFRPSLGIYVRVPATSVVAHFAITDPAVVARREIIDLEKCKVCHDGVTPDGLGRPIWRLGQHGANRNEEPRACVVCHNPNQTDIPYRRSGDEVSLDFKRLIHAIHGASKREQQLLVIGYLGFGFNFGGVAFPGGRSGVRQCTKCHIDRNGRGTFELPLAPEVLGSTIDTQSVPGVFLDQDPANDTKITPTAAVCSACHDGGEARQHMQSASAGGSFATTQAAIDAGLVRERCANCHAPGMERESASDT